MPRISNSTTSKKAAKANSAVANRALADANNRLEAQLAELRLQLEAACVAAPAPAPAPGNAAVMPLLVPCIPGEHGRQYNLAKELEPYGVARRQYNHMLAEVCDSARIAQLDRNAYYRAQDPVKLAQIIALMRKRFPVLKRFASDWVTVEMLKQCLRNWRAKAKANADIIRNDSNDDTDNVNMANSRVGSPEI
ncbi:hypothetical protein FS842_007220 [Serendipita sp. 407]|nr:hypothetical protein FS842_007220 [Serendipita sp. 407]